MSSQIGWPDGASAECGSARPSASATTCAVAAVPRNWQPPPGDRAGRGSPARPPLRSDELAVGEARADRLDLARVLAVGRRQRHAAGHEHAPAGRACAASAIIIAGRPLSQVATPSTPRRVGSERISRRKHDRRVVAVGQAVHHAGRALRAAVARVGDEAGERHRRRARSSSSRRRLHEQADLPVAGVIARARSGVPSGARMPPCVLRIRNSGPRRRRGLPAHAGVLRQAEQVAAGRVAQQVGVSGRAPIGPAAWVWIASRSASGASTGVGRVSVGSVMDTRRMLRPAVVGVRTRPAFRRARRAA